MLQVETIKPEMTYDIRHHILRPHQSFQACQYATDHEEGAFHVGAFAEEKLISIASFCAANNKEFATDKQYRLRAMATFPAFRKQGAGRMIVRFAASLLREKGVELLWCKGRTSVQPYYEKLGFKQHGEVFDYPPIGPHVVMYKQID